MLAKKNETHDNIKYELTSKITSIHFNGVTRVWGIVGYDEIKSGGSIVDIVYFDDVSSNCESAIKIIKSLRDNKVSLIHMKEVIENLLILGY